MLDTNLMLRDFLIVEPNPTQATYHPIHTLPAIPTLETKRMTKRKRENKNKAREKNVGNSNRGKK